jgi:hypothetical protein
MFPIMKAIISIGGQALLRFHGIDDGARDSTSLIDLGDCSAIVLSDYLRWDMVRASRRKWRFPT